MNVFTNILVCTPNQHENVFIIFFSIRGRFNRRKKKEMACGATTIQDCVYIFIESKNQLLRRPQN